MLQEPELTALCHHSWTLLVCTLTQKEFEGGLHKCKQYSKRIQMMQFQMQQREN